MNRVQLRTVRRLRRKRSIRKSVFGLPRRPRLTVFRSGKHIYAQVIDDLAGRTIAAASSLDKEGRPDNGGNVAAATEVGKRLASRAKDAGIEKVAFDRNGYKYHGRVKALADGAREGGLKF
ncbi:MAG: 50S ribosomal protein L18 [Planctomycetota bacterium]